MRMNTPRLLTAGLSMAAVMTVVYAAGPRDAQLEPKAYLSMAFGGASTAARQEQFFYGLRLDHDRRYRGTDLAPMADLNFNRQGFNQARLNGLPVIYRNTALQQAEGESAASEGMFSNFTFVDWSLIGVGAVAIGFGISEVVNQKDTRDPRSTTTGGTTGGQNTAAVTGAATAATGAATAAVAAVTAAAGGYAELRGSGAEERDIERALWLDGGTGQMGDLTPQP